MLIMERLSKKEKRALRLEAYKAKRKVKRKEKRAQKRAKRLEAEGGRRETKLENVTPEEKVQRAEARKARKAHGRSRAIARMQCAPTVVIDLQFWDKMREGEQKSCMQQLMYSYSANKIAERPVRLAFTSTPPEALSHFPLSSWKETGYLHAYELPLAESVEASSVVYLTADAEEELPPGATRPDEGVRYRRNR